MPGSNQLTDTQPAALAAKGLWWALLIICLTTLGSAGPARAHGVELVKEDRPTVQVRASYSDGEPMNYSEVMIYAPDDPQRAFQRGSTDRLGRFAFCPHLKGSWRVIVSDGMGHKIDQSIEVGKAAGVVQSIAPQAAGIPMVYKILVGLSLIFGLFGLAVIILTRRNTPNQVAGPPHQGKVP